MAKTAIATPDPEDNEGSDEVDEVTEVQTEDVGGNDESVTDAPTDEDGAEDEDGEDGEDETEEGDVFIEAASPERLAQLDPLAVAVLANLKGKFDDFKAKSDAYKAAVTDRVALPTWKEQLLASQSEKIAFGEVSIGDQSLRKVMAHYSANNPGGLVQLLNFIDELRTLVNNELAACHINAFRLPEGVPTRDELVELTTSFAGDFKATKGFIGRSFDWSQLVGYTGVPVKLKGVRGENGDTEAYAGPKYNRKKTTAAGSKALQLKSNTRKVRLVVDGKIIDDLDFGQAMKIHLDMPMVLLNKWLAENGINDFGALWRMEAVRFTDDSGTVHAASFVPTGTKDISEAHTALLAAIQAESAQAAADKAAREITSSGKDELPKDDKAE